MIDKEALLRRMEKQYRDLWRSLRGWLDRAPAELLHFAEELPEIFAQLERENELRNKREVYLAVGRFLHDKLKKPLPVCVGAVHALCREQDPRLTEDGAVKIDDVVVAARALIVGIKVHYELRDSHTYQRRIEVFFLKDGKPTVSRIEDELAWEALPSDVREDRLREGRKVVSFTLFPKKEA